MFLKSIFRRNSMTSPRIFSKISSGYPKKKNNRAIKWLLRIAILLLISIVFTSIIRLYIIFPITVNNHSMFPGIVEGSLVFVVYPYLTKLQRGNILFIRHEPQRLSLICRLVALSGEVLEIKQKKYISTTRYSILRAL